MICSEFFELLDNYELLNENQLSEMEKHTEQCESCRKELEFFRSIVTMTSEIPVPNAPKSLIDDVNARLDEKPATGFKPNFRVLSTVAACLAIGLAVGLNNGYIKDNIAPDDTDGVITETVVTSDVPDMAVAEADDAEPTVEAAKKPEAKPQNKVEHKATEAPTKAPAVASQKPTERPATSQKPTSAPIATPTVETTQTPEATPNVDELVGNYEVSDVDNSNDYAYYSVGARGRVRKPQQDYLYVKSHDMGTVVSTMSEIGIQTVDGYCVSSREEFRELLAVLNAKNVGFECDLQTDMGDVVAFKLTYN